MLLGQVGQLRPGALLQVSEALRGQVAVGRAGQGQDRLADVHVAVERRPAVGDAAAHGAVLVPQVVDLLGLSSKVTPLVVAPRVSTSGPSAAIFSATAP